MNVEANDIWTMILSTIRYSMGRRTYMPSECESLYHRYKGALTLAQRKQIGEEIEKELELVNRSPSFGPLLGDACDHAVWVRLAKTIREEGQ